MSNVDRVIQVVEQGLYKKLPTDDYHPRKLELRKRMAYYKVPGFSIAVIEAGELVWSKGYGIMEAGGVEAVTLETIFQAASMSKPVSAMVALHLVEHLADPPATIRQVARILSDEGLFLFATPNPVYALRPLKRPDVTPDAISKAPTHISVHPPETWQHWAEEAGFRVLRAFGDGLWDVPYLPLIPKPVQFAMFGWPSLVQVLTRGTLVPVGLGVNLVVIARKVRTYSK